MNYKFIAHIIRSKFVFFLVYGIFKCPSAQCQEVQTGCFFYESKVFFEHYDSTDCTTKFMVDNQINRTNYFDVSKIWNEKKQRFQNVKKDYWACKKGDKIYYNLTKVNEMQIFNRFIKFDIIGLVSAIIIPEENFEDFPRDAYTGFGLFIDIAVEKARESRGVVYDKDGKVYLMILVDREGEKHDYIEPRGLFVRKKVLEAIAQRHSVELNIDFDAPLRLEEVVRFIHGINHNKGLSIMEYEPAD